MKKQIILWLGGILAVLTILAVLIFGAAQRVCGSHKVPQPTAAARMLRMGLICYRHDYGHWPIPDSLTNRIISANGCRVLAITNRNENAAIFKMLQVSNLVDNPNNIRYLDCTTLYTVNAKNQQGTLCSIGTNPAVAYPVGYLTKKKTVAFYTITFNLDLETAEVLPDPNQP